MSDRRYGTSNPQGGYHPKIDGEAACRMVEALVSAAFMIDPAVLDTGRRGPAQVTLARQAAMYLAHVELGMSFVEVGRCFGRDRTTVAHACARMEDRRDNSQLARVFDCLEAALIRCRGSCRAEGAPR